MATKSILLAVADPQVLVDVVQALGAGWEAVSVPSEADALDHLGKRSFDALLVDFNMGSPDASEILNQCEEKHPTTARFLLAYEADLALVAAKVSGSPQILSKPVDPASVKSRIEQGLNDSEGTEEQNSAPETPSGEAPAVPSIYNELLKLLESPEVTTKAVGEMIASDASLLNETLRLTQSAYRGLPRDVSDPVQAVESLGLDAVKALVSALRFLAEHSRLKPGYLSVDQIWQHSTNVAQIARDLVLFETKDRVLASQAMAAGLVHDLGKVVLVTNFEDLYGRVYSLARKQPVPIWDIEKEMFGANHGEIGACLVGMWNLPIAIVDATALHHEPPAGEDDQLTPLAAVHIANVLEHQLRPNDDCRVAPVVNTAFLNQLGLLQRLPIWRAAYSKRGNSSQFLDPTQLEVAPAEPQAPMLEPALPSTTGNQLPAPPAVTRTGTAGQADSMDNNAAPRRRKRWIYAAVVSVILLCFAAWLRTYPEPEEFAPVYARGSATHHVPATTPAEPAPQTVPNSDAKAGPDTLASEPAQDTNTIPVSPARVTVSPAVTAAAPVVVPAVATNVAEVTAAVPPKPAQPQFRINGIIYSFVSPSAIVNGKTVYTGDQIDGATVLRILPTSVTLDIDGLRRTYHLR